MTHEINHTVTASIEYKTPAEKWGQVRCENCRFWKYSGSCIKLSFNRSESLRMNSSASNNVTVKTAPDFGCVLGEAKDE